VGSLIFINLTTTGLTKCGARLQNVVMKQKLSLISTVTVSLAMAIALGSSSAAALEPASVTHGLRGHSHLLNGTSTNWSGYAVETNLKTPLSGAVSDVSGSWVVPTVVCPIRSTNYSSAWVGIDGYSGNTVEQTGTEMDCQRGRAQYYAWYEFYPQSEIAVSTVAVHPGDVMKGDVTFAGTNTFVVTITDQTTARSFSLSHRMNGTARQSAEWIAEAPSSWFGILPLANFGTMNFTNSTATLNGHAGTINDPSWQNDPLTMVTSGGQPKDALLPLSTDGTSFGVNWLHN